MLIAPMIKAPTIPIEVPNKKQIAPNKALIAKDLKPAKVLYSCLSLLRSRSKPINKPQPRAAAMTVMNSSKDVVCNDIVIGSSILLPLWFIVICRFESF
ncbi:hypothetical protein D9M71_372800 [compost metagenome]